MITALLFALLAAAYSNPVEPNVLATRSYSDIYRMVDLANSPAWPMDAPCLLYISVSKDPTAIAYEQNIEIQNSNGEKFRLTNVQQYDQFGAKMPVFQYPSQYFTINNTNAGSIPTYDNQAVFYFVYQSVGKDRNSVYDVTTTGGPFSFAADNIGYVYYTLLSPYTNMVVSNLRGINGLTYVNIFAGGYSDAQNSRNQLIQVQSGDFSSPYVFLEPAVTFNKGGTVSSSGFQLQAYAHASRNATNVVNLNWGEKTVFTTPNAFLLQKSWSATYKFTNPYITKYTLSLTGDLPYSSLRIQSSSSKGNDDQTVTNLNSKNNYKLYSRGGDLTITYTRDSRDFSYGLYATIQADRSATSITLFAAISISLVKAFML